jgi:hypothetical protein
VRIRHNQYRIPATCPGRNENVVWADGCAVTFELGAYMGCFLSIFRVEGPGNDI